MSGQIYDELLNSQKNSIFRLIKQSDLAPVDFEWEKTTEEDSPNILVDALVHKPSKFFMVFGKNRRDHGGEKFTVYYSPGSEARQEAERLYDWNNVISVASQWLSRLKSEWETPNLWEKAAKGEFFVDSNKSNTKFSKHELKIVKERMETVRLRLLSSAEGDESRVSDINAKLDYLILQSSKIGRRDWIMMVYGYIFTNVSNWGINAINFEIITNLLFTGIHAING